MPAGALEITQHTPGSHLTTSQIMYSKQHTRTHSAASLAHPSPQRMFSTDGQSTATPSKASTPPVDPHHKDSVIEHVYTNDGPSMDRHIITPSPAMSENVSEMIMNEIRAMKQTYVNEITILKTEINTIKETHAAEIGLLKRQLQRQQAEMSEWIVAHEKSEAWRYEFEREASVRRSKQDVVLMDLSVQNQTIMTRMNDLSQELAHTRARLPMVAATADAAAVSAAQAVASAKALAQRPQQRNNDKNKKKPRKQSTPLLPTPPRHLWQNMQNAPNQQQQQQQPQQQQSQQQQPQQAQPHSQPSSASSTPRNVSPQHMTQPAPQPSSRMIRFSSVPNASKHRHNDSLSDVFGNYMDEDGGMIEDELTLYMKNRSRAQTTPPTGGISPSMQQQQGGISPPMLQQQPSQSQQLQGIAFAF